MYELKGKLTGVAPILFNRFINPEGLDQGRKKTIKADRDTLNDQKCFKDKQGLYLPAENLKNALTGTQGSRGAAQIIGGEIESKKGRAYAEWCKACLFVMPSRLYFGRDTYDDIDGRVGKNWNAKGAAIWIERPFLKEGWELPFTAQVVDDTAKPEFVKRFFEVAGLRVGVGSFRPQFGRFLVEWA